MDGFAFLKCGYHLQALNYISPEKLLHKEKLSRFFIIHKNVRTAAHHFGNTRKRAAPSLLRSPCHYCTAFEEVGQRPFLPKNIRHQ
jgi:hypothetical protein